MFNTFPFDLRKKQSWRRLRRANMNRSDLVLDRSSLEALSHTHFGPCARDHRLAMSGLTFPNGSQNNANANGHSTIPAATNGDSDVPHLLNYINGKFVPPHSNRFLLNPNPATNTPISYIPQSDKADIADAVAAATAAYPSWSMTPVNVRADYLDKIAAVIERRFDELVAMESSDAGKPLVSAANMDIPRSILNFRFFAGAIRHDTTDSHWMADAVNITQRAPIGVCGLITPWNLPIYLLSWKVAPALAMGNTVVCKPSELTPMTASALAEIVAEVGLPAGVFNLVHGTGPEAGQALIEHPNVPLISFTGGTVTGRRVASVCAPAFKKLSLELGGKNSTIVFADCDFDLTVKQAARAAFTNAGQVCLCGSRLLVEEPLYERFVAAFVEEVKSMTVGDPATARIGSLTSLAHREKIEKYVELARADGGRILCGGSRPKLPPPFDAGAFYSPTVITDLQHDHRCSVEEIFGPVVTVHSFKTEAEALSIANETPYGLAGSLWTNDLNRAHRVGRLWQTGMVWVNCWLHRDLRVPFGGVKESGMGSEGGRHSLEFYSSNKNICIHFGASPQLTAAVTPATAK